MTEPYLILHKVRGEPAFDIAIKLDHVSTESLEEIWIVSTSGHRAYPWRYMPLQHLTFTCPDYFEADIPVDWPDHYSCNDRPLREDKYVVNQRAKGILETLGLVKKVTVERRF